MGWSIGYDAHWERDVGYGVPCLCDHPDCNEEINRGLGYVCGGEPFGGDFCGLYFCGKHMFYDADAETQLCERCVQSDIPFELKPDIKKWRDFKKTDDSWAKWREENPQAALAL